MNDVPAATLGDAPDPAASAMAWLSGEFKGVQLVGSVIIVPRFGGVEVHVGVPEPGELDLVEVVATVLTVNPKHPLFPAIVAEGRRIFASEFVVVSIGSERRLKLRRTLPSGLATETALLQSVAEVGVAAARLHGVLLPIFSSTPAP